MRGRDRNDDTKRTGSRKALKPTRPTMTFEKMTPERQAIYISWLEKGATYQNAARKVGCSRYFIREYAKTHPEFDTLAEEARLRGWDHLTNDVEDALYRAAMKGNVAAMLAWLYNRRKDKWCDMRTLRLKTMDDVLSLLPPKFVKSLRPFLGGALDRN